MNPVFNKPLNNQQLNKEDTSKDISKDTPNEPANGMPNGVSNDMSNDLLNQFIDMVFGGSIAEQENDNKNNTIREKKSERHPERHSKKQNEVSHEVPHEVPQENSFVIKTPSTAVLDFKNNCIVVNNNKYYIERFTSETNITINRLVKLDNVFTIEQFAEKYVNRNLFQVKILTNDLLIYFNNERKFIVKLINKNSKIKDYIKFLNCAYLKPDLETKPISDLLKMDQIIKAQAYFEFELKPRITYLENEVEYEVFDEVLDFLYNTDKETLKITFKELIKCDKEYLSDCALTGKFKKICIVDYTKTKRIYNN